MLAQDSDDDAPHARPARARPPDRPTQLLRSRAREIGIAGLLLVVFATPARLTTAAAITAADARVDVAANLVVSVHRLLAMTALLVTTAGSPISIDVLTGIAALLVAFRWGALGQRVAVYLIVARMVELGSETAVKSRSGTLDRSCRTR